MNPHLRRALFVAAATLAIPASAQQWTQLFPSTIPGARNSPAMAWDSVRGVAVLHGGAMFPGTIYTDTWEWNGTDWTLRAAAGGPGRNGHAMAYDSARQKMVSFGGSPGGVQSLGTTFEYDGTSWTQLFPTNAPLARQNHTMCFDPVRGVTVLFGGHFTNLTNAAYGDTWEWNGSNWTQRNPAASPPARVYHAMAWDSARNVAVLFGGRAASGGGVDDTWEWNGTTWTQRLPANSPPVRIDHEMAFDPVRARCVVHSGVLSPLGDTWEWDGTDWTPGATMPGQTTTRHAFGFCWDGNRQRVVLFGGYTAGQVDETWLYGATPVASYTTAGIGCAGNNGTPAIAAAPGSLPRLGQTFTARLTGLGAVTLGVAGLSDTTSGSTPLPADLGGLGMPGCWQYVSLDAFVALPTSGGTASWSLGVPSTATLIGARIHQQAATDASGVNPFGFVTSNYGTMTVGP